MQPSSSGPDKAGPDKADSRGPSAAIHAASTDRHTAYPNQESLV
jgi:hypothetical protein